MDEAIFHRAEKPGPRATDAPAKPRPSLTLQLIETIEDFRDLRGEWMRLFASAATPQQLFQSHGFLTHWTEHYLSPGKRLAVIAGRRGGALSLVVPLVRQRRAGVDLLNLMGAPVAQFGDIIVDRDNVGADELAQVWSFLCALGSDLFVASRIRSDAAFVTIAGERGIQLARYHAPFASLGCRVSGDEPGATYSAKVRSNYRRRMRRLTEQGGLAVERIPAGSAADLALEAITMKRAWLKAGGRISPTVADPRFAAFFAAIAADPSCETPLHATALTLSGRRLGIDLSFDGLGHSFGHVLAVSPEGEQWSAGQLLVHTVFAAAKRRGNTLFELNAPADAYKMQHADGVVEVGDLAFPFTARGRLYTELMLKRALPAAKAIAGSMPKSLARLMMR